MLINYALYTIILFVHTKTVTKYIKILYLNINCIWGYF